MGKNNGSDIWNQTQPQTNNETNQKSDKKEGHSQFFKYYVSKAILMLIIFAIAGLFFLISHFTGSDDDWGDYGQNTVQTIEIDA